MGNKNYTREEWSFLLALSVVDQMFHSGITHLVASPGFRNSPLLLAAHLRKKIKVISSIDERGAAFLALGLSKGGKSAALLCTSGTATANYYPAIMEAFEAAVPLLVLTADRPHEMVGTGANQCTRQSNLFADHLRFSAELECFEDVAQQGHGAYVVAKAISLSRFPAAGPVHVNVRLREPFLPKEKVIEELLESTSENSSLGWAFVNTPAQPEKVQLEAIQLMLRAAERPLILVGPSDLSIDEKNELKRLFSRWEVPLLAENASGVFGAEENILHGVDGLFAALRKGEIPPPDLLIRFGAPLTGRALERFLAEIKIPQVIFERDLFFREPHLHPSVFVQGGTLGWLKALQELPVNFSCQKWLSQLVAHQKKEKILKSERIEKFGFTEWLFHSRLDSMLSDRALVFLGNSMPIRDFNSVFESEKDRLEIFSNRGLSGIDGLIATALGVALARGKPTHLVIGDLSVIHDLSSMHLARQLQEEAKLTIWIMNNKGGEIFRIVPTSEAGGKEDWFTTPPAVDFASVAKSFQLPFARISNTESLLDLPHSHFEDWGVRVMELCFEREANLAVRGME